MPPSRKNIIPKTVVFLIGPTSSGKTDVALRLAHSLKAEIVSCDSMQVYKGMDILSSQPQERSFKKAKHHLFAFLSPVRDFNVAEYRNLALNKIASIHKKGKVPLFVGGTGFYMSVLLDGIFDEKTQDPLIRKRLYDQAQRLGGDVLYKRLKKGDPQAALRIHPNDIRRVVRALEVYEKTGVPISEWQKKRSGIWDKYRIRVFGLSLSRKLLYKRIDERVEKMFRAGMVDEVRRLIKRKLSRTASCAIGIREIKGYLQGESSLEETISLIKRNTRHYAKRQLTWFKRDPRVEWIKVGEKQKPQETACRIYRKLKKHF